MERRNMSDADLRQVASGAGAIKWSAKFWSVDDDNWLWITLTDDPMQ